MSDAEETFLAKVAMGDRITIYEPIRQFLGIEVGDFIRVTVRLERKGSIEVSQPETEEEEEEEEPAEEQEYVELCPNGLDRPLQDLDVCRGKCEHYKRKHGKSPEACKWTEWKKIGWEDEAEEEPVKDIAEEPIAEEEIIESEYDEVMLYCESGAHKAEVIPHRKKDLGRGWAEYTCTICKKATPMKISKAEGVLEA